MFSKINAAGGDEVERYDGWRDDVTRPFVVQWQLLILFGPFVYGLTSFMHSGEFALKSITSC